MVTYVKKFSFGGGEPLTRADLPELIEFMMGYKTQIGVLEVITNGTIMPNQKLLKTMKKNADKITVLVDNYGKLSPLAEDIGECLSKNGISNQVRTYFGENPHCGGWVDFGDYSLKHPTREEQIELFKKCAYYTQTTKVGVACIDGILCTGARAFFTLKRKVVSSDNGGYVDILDPTKSLAQLKKEFIDLLNIEVPPACAYCNGMCADSPRYAPAEQIGT